MKITTTKSVAKIVEIKSKQKRKKTAAEINLNQLQNIFLNAPTALCILEGIEHKYILANKAYEKLTNRKATDLLGKNIREVFPELIGTGTFELFDKVFETGEPFIDPEYAAMIDVNNEGVLQHCYFNFSVEPMKNDSGEIYAVMAIIYDITEQVEARKKNEESENQLSFAIAATELGIWDYNPLTNKYKTNERVKQWFGLPVEEEVDMSKAILLVAENDRLHVTEATLKALQWGSDDYDIEYTIINAQTLEERIVRAKGKSTFGNDKVAYRFSGTLQDITAQTNTRKRLEESEEQQAFLLRFSDKLRAEPTVDAVANCALQMLSEHLKLDRCYIGVYQLAEDRGVFPYQVGNERVPPMPDSVRLSDFPDALRVAFDGTLVIDDVTKAKGLADTDRQNLSVLGLCALVAATLRHGENNPLWSIVSVSASPRRWTLSNVKLIEEVTERTWAAVERAKAEEAIRKSEEKYRSLFNSIDQGFARCELVRNKEGKAIDYYVLDVNPTYEKQTGLTLEMALGKTILQSFPLLDKWWIETYAAVIDNQCPVEFEQYFEFTNRWFAIKAYPNEKDKFAVLFNDITERKQAEEKLRESESRFRTMADASPVLIWTIDANGLSSYYNKTFLDFLGVSKDEDISDWKKIVHPDDVKSTIDIINTTIAERRSYALECRLLRADGQWRSVLTQGNPSMGDNNEFLGFVGSSVDITERKQAEEELIKANVVAENATKSKQQFLSNMSHEIRTPLNSIIGFANVLLKTELDVEQKEFLQAINTSGKSLNLLIDDILDLAKVDTGKMTFETQPFEIRKTITSILHSFDLKIKEKNLKLVKEYDSKIPYTLLGDSLRLNQIFLNIVSNAVKFTHKGRIIISVKLLNETQESVTLEFTVTDSGIGIAANKMDLIFNVFEQAGLSTANSYGGTGLGLAIVKQLVEAQGGSISVKSKLGEGSTFSFVLPFGKTNIKLEGEVELLKSDSEIKNLRVLVAEDVALNQLLIKLILSDFGFECEIVDNGRIAIERMQNNTYDIILMDLQMPEMNGFETTEYIRKTLKSQIPIIALTADVTTVDVSKCKEFGMDDYISKPIDENLLYSKIVELVKKK